MAVIEPSLISTEKAPQGFLGICLIFGLRIEFGFGACSGGGGSCSAFFRSSLEIGAQPSMAAIPNSPGSQGSFLEPEVLISCAIRLTRIPDFAWVVRLALVGVRLRNQLFHVVTGSPSQ